MVVGIPRPHLRLRRETTKGKKARTVPLWWDAGTLADLVAWKVERGEQGAWGDAAFVYSMQAHRRGEAIQRHAIRLRFLSACKVRTRTPLTMPPAANSLRHWPSEADPPAQVGMRGSGGFSASPRMRW